MIRRMLGTFREPISHLRFKRDRALFVLGLPLLLFAWGCDVAAKPDLSTGTIHLVDLYSEDSLRGSLAPAADAPQPVIWDFSAEQADGAGPELGWEGLGGIAGLAVRGGHLTGRISGENAALHVAWDGSGRPIDQLRAVEIKIFAAAFEVHITFQGGEEVDLAALSAEKWKVTVPLLAMPAVQTVTAIVPPGIRSDSIRHVFIRPGVAGGLGFRIKSLRLIFRDEYLREFESGVVWQGVGGVFHEALVTKAPESVHLTAELPRRAVLDLSVASVTEGPVKFRVEVTPKSGGMSPLVRVLTLTTPDRWSPFRIDLSELEGREVEIKLALAGADNGVVGIWGSPAIRSTIESTPNDPDATAAEPPQGVILILVDTLRRDHLDLYGYERSTAPNLARMANEGTVFENCQVQATWTKVSVPSILSSLYPLTHKVHEFTDRLPSSATTLAEVFREAGYATISYSSVMFTGKFTNLHQGFEQLHEFTSIEPDIPSKTARTYVDRLLPWLEERRDVPFFVFLHLFDPHDPFEPHSPYDTLWADADLREEHLARTEHVKNFIAHPIMKQFAMPTRAELGRAQVDADAFVSYNKDWYDGSIREMDAQLERIFERLRDLGIDDKTLIVFTSDHGEEFLEHGSTFHGQSLYGELTNVPLIFWRPGQVKSNESRSEVVQSIDIMPTILELAGLEAPDEVQGQSLAPLIEANRDADAPQWEDRPAFTEKAKTVGPFALPGGHLETYSVISGGWKLVHHTQRPKSTAEFELYDIGEDPLNLNDVAAEHPDVVERLAEEIVRWREFAVAEAEQLKTDDQAAEGMTAKALERLRGLGYLQ